MQLPADDPRRLLMDELHKLGTPVEVNLAVIRMCAESAERCRQLKAHIVSNRTVDLNQILREAHRLEMSIPLTEEEELENRIEDE